VVDIPIADAVADKYGADAVVAQAGSESFIVEPMANGSLGRRTKDHGLRSLNTYGETCKTRSCKQYVKPGHGVMNNGVRCSSCGEVDSFGVIDGKLDFDRGGGFMLRPPVVEFEPRHHG
jgi:hypothetical protein